MSASTLSCLQKPLPSRSSDDTDLGIKFRECFFSKVTGQYQKMAKNMNCAFSFAPGYHSLSLSDLTSSVSEKTNQHKHKSIKATDLFGTGDDVFGGIGKFISTKRIDNKLPDQTKDHETGLCIGNGLNYASKGLQKMKSDITLTSSFSDILNGPNNVKNGLASNMNGIFGQTIASVERDEAFTHQKQTIAATTLKADDIKVASSNAGISKNSVPSIQENPALLNNLQGLAFLNQLTSLLQNTDVLSSLGNMSQNSPLTSLPANQPKPKVFEPRPYPFQRNYNQKQMDANNNYSDFPNLSTRNNQNHIYYNSSEVQIPLKPVPPITLNNASYGANYTTQEVLRTLLLSTEQQNANISSGKLGPDKTSIKTVGLQREPTSSTLPSPIFSSSTTAVVADDRSVRTGAGFYNGSKSSSICPSNGTNNNNSFKFKDNRHDNSLWIPENAKNGFGDNLTRLNLLEELLRLQQHQSNVGETKTKTSFDVAALLGQANGQSNDAKPQIECSRDHQKSFRFTDLMASSSSTNSNARWTTSIQNVNSFAPNASSNIINGLDSMTTNYSTGRGSGLIKNFSGNNAGEYNRQTTGGFGSARTFVSDENGIFPDRKADQMHVSSPITQKNFVPTGTPIPNGIASNQRNFANISHHAKDMSTILEGEEESFLSTGSSFASDNDLCAILNNLSMKSSSFSNWSSLSGNSSGQLETDMTRKGQHQNAYNNYNVTTTTYNNANGGGQVGRISKLKSSTNGVGGNDYMNQERKLALISSLLNSVQCGGPDHRHNDHQSSTSVRCNSDYIKNGFGSINSSTSLIDDMSGSQINLSRAGRFTTCEETITPGALNAPGGPYCVEKVAKLYKNAAAICDATYTWSGQLPPRNYRNPVYSTKIFLGGVPWDITELGLMASFKPFGDLRIEWPGKETLHPRYPPKGYVYILFESDKSVKALLQSCTHDFSNGGDFYYKISSKRMRCKEVQVIPWVISDTNFIRQPSQRLDPCKTVFVGALHGLINAEGLACVMNDLFGGVVYAGVDTDKFKYPIGSGRVTFNNHKSYMKAVSAAFVEIKTPKFVKRVQIDPYLEDAFCNVCKIRSGIYFCRDMLCFKYFCERCWYYHHNSTDPASSCLINNTHKPLMRNVKKDEHNVNMMMV